jgi:hypothetical protein
MADAHPHRTPPDSRRAFVKKAAYIAPVVLTLPVTLSAAQVGSSGAPCPVWGEVPPSEWPRHCDS